MKEKLIDNWKMIVGSAMVMIPILPLLLYLGHESGCWWEPFAWCAGTLMAIAWLFIAVYLIQDWISNTLWRGK